MMLDLQKGLENGSMEKRRIRISSKRQVTIPAKYYDSLELSDEVDCIYANNMLIFLPVKRQDSVFAEEILADLIQQGYTGETLLAEFKKINRQIRPAVEQIIREADALAKVASENYRDLTDEIFGSDDEVEA
ncbi:MAG TPA: AbrB family transcriptional regulator [Firmicutes bacterium]|nr:AbrB family transcriptional regulator [Bacillota bacterium]